MDAYCAIKLILGHTALDADGNSLSDFSGTWGANVETNDSRAVSLVHDNLHVAVAFATGNFFRVLPLEGLELSMEDRYIFRTEVFLGIYFCVSTCTILEGSEDGRWHVNVVHERSLSSEKTVGEQQTCLDGHRGQLQLLMENVTDSINMRHIGLLVLVYGVDLAILRGLNSGLVKSEVLRQSVAPDSEQNCIILFRDLFFTLFESDSDLAFWVILFHF